MHSDTAKIMYPNLGNFGSIFLGATHVTRGVTEAGLLYLDARSRDSGRPINLCRGKIAAEYQALCATEMERIITRF